MTEIERQQDPEYFFVDVCDCGTTKAFYRDKPPPEDANTIVLNRHRALSALQPTVAKKAYTMKCDRKWWNDGRLERDKAWWRKETAFRCTYVRSSAQFAFLFRYMDRLGPTNHLLYELYIPRQPPPTLFKFTPK